MSRRGTEAPELLPLKWRPRPPGSQSAGTLFQYIREYLCRHGGSAGKSELLHAVEADPRMRRRLEKSQGFDRVLANMRYSGWVEVTGELVKATPKTVRRTLV